MPTPILATKLYILLPRSKAVLRPRLVERLNEGLHGKLALISAPAGFGKTTLVSEWVGACAQPAAWLSLDAEDGSPKRFGGYFSACISWCWVIWSTSEVNIERWGKRALEAASLEPMPQG